MQRREYNVRMTEALVTAEIMEFYGKGGIPGVTAASCEGKGPWRLTSECAITPAPAPNPTAAARVQRRGLGG